jgi:plasmid segregation protein ParM
MRDKTQDDRFFILTLFAIARELVRTGSSSPLSQIDLAVGLPPEHYGVLKDRFANYFKRKDPIRFVYHDRPYIGIPIHRPRFIDIGLGRNCVGCVL